MIQPVVRVGTAMLEGVEAAPVTVEATPTESGYGIDIVGLPDAAVRESRLRILRAVQGFGVEFIDRRVLFNLAPATRKKVGGVFDLPMAAAYVAALRGLDLPRAPDLLVCGEIDLEGRVTGCAGALPVAVLARRIGARGLVLPTSAVAEAEIVEGLPLFGVEDLGEAIAVLRGAAPRAPRIGRAPDPDLAAPRGDRLGSVRGQEAAKRALLVAAAGGHNLLMVGPPGSGKTMLARSLPEILPPLELGAAIEVACVHAAAGSSRRDRLFEPPFRAPHHTASRQALVGGGHVPRPGEVTLAHGGVLFLDEIPEFGKEALEVLRQPLEDLRVVIARTREVRTFPADFALVAAMNPCPCGHAGDPERRCRCTPRRVADYRGRLSGPLLDRIDLHVPVRRVSLEEIAARREGLGAEEARERVAAARRRQLDRAGRCNARLSGDEVEAACALDPEVRRRLVRSLRGLGVSARSFVRILRVARTLADLSERATVGEEDLLEAVQYRPAAEDAGG